MINWIGFGSLYKKEVLRFIKVYNQTLITPVINSLLFLAIFMLAIGERIPQISGLPFAEFMAPGLISMVIVQNSFANASSSMTMGKVLGHYIDLLIPPLSAFEISWAMVLAAATRGIIAGVLASIAIKFFVPITIYDFTYLVIYVILTSAILGVAGFICGIVSNSFDQMAAVTSYIITPLSFLSGTFYSIKNLPDIWQKVSQYNPFFYMIDGIRYAMTSYHDGNLLIGIIYLILFFIILFITAIIMLRSGFRMRS